MKIVILGGGQLAYDLKRTISDAISLSHSDLDICDYSEVQRILDDLQPDIIINCASYHNLSACELNPEAAFQVNALAVRNLAQYCQNNKVLLVHFSTNYVFNGDHYVGEEEAVDPINVYGVSKVAGEFFVKHICKKYLLIRTAGLFGIAGNSSKGGNFIDRMIEKAGKGETIQMVNDQILSPTYTLDLAQKVYELIKKKKYGLYHITNSGECSWYQFTKQIFKFLKMKIDVKPIKTSPNPPHRPKLGFMYNDRLINNNLGTLPYWDDALKRYLIEKGLIKEGGNNGH